MTSTLTADEREALEAKLVKAVAGMGRELTQDLLKSSQQLYVNLHDQEPYAGVTLHKDIRYGTHERHRLDIFEPHDGDSGRPVLIYVHGGGFVRGDKKTPGLPYFHNIGVWAARRGFVGVNTTYRLAPQHTTPAAEEDVAAVVEWARNHVVEFGGDPRRIVLMGHSAGAILVACHLASIGEATRGILGAIVGSGNYDFGRLRNAENVHNYFGDDYAKHSPLAGLKRSRVPLLVSIGEYETHDFQEQALVLVNALFERDGTLPRFVLQSGQNHFTSCFRIGFGRGDPIEREMEAFIRAECNRRSD